MRVLYFHQHFSTPKGAVGIRSYEMAKRLIERGHDVTMVCGSYSGGETGIKEEFKKGRRRAFVDGIDVVEFDLSYSNSDGFIQRAFTFLKFAFYSVGIALIEKYDLVFATTTPLTAGIPGIFSRWFRGKPFVFEVRDLWPELPKEMGVIKNPIILWLMGVLEWVSYRSADRCIGLSPGIVNGIMKCGVPRDRISLVPNGCDLDLFSDDLKPWRPEGIKDTDLLAVFAGTHGEANGLDSVLDTANYLKSLGRVDIKFLLIGQGKLKSRLQKRAYDENLDNVIFHEPINKSRLAGLMASTDIGLQVLANIPAFYYGTSPNKFFDYISAGLPVLNNYPGWLAELITNHQCGYTVEANNPTAFGDALIHASENKNELKVMGANSKLLAKSEFNRVDLSNQFVDCLELANA